MKRIGVVVGLAAVLAVVLLWRCSGSNEKARAKQPAAGHQAATTGSAVTPKRVDPRKLERGSIAGTITDKATKQPIAGAKVCADGWSHDAPGDVFNDPTCVVTDDNGAYRIDKLLAANYV